MDFNSREQVFLAPHHIKEQYKVKRTNDGQCWISGRRFNHNIFHYLLSSIVMDPFSYPNVNLRFQNVQHLSTLSTWTVIMKWLDTRTNWSVNAPNAFHTRSWVLKERLDLISPWLLPNMIVSRQETISFYALTKSDFFSFSSETES